MTGRQRFTTIVIGLAGVTASVFALTRFLLKILRNRLESPDGATLQAFYRLVGAAYSDGFVAGFALCFFLTLLAVATGTWFEARREKKLQAAAGNPIVARPSAN
jgi:Sec-independent protein secretion pathway component TatC